MRKLFVAGLLALLPSMGSAATLNFSLEGTCREWGCEDFGLQPGGKFGGTVTAAIREVAPFEFDEPFIATGYLMVTSFDFLFPTMRIASSNSSWGARNPEEAAFFGAFYSIGNINGDHFGRSFMFDVGSNWTDDITDVSGWMSIASYASTAWNGEAHFHLDSAKITPALATVPLPAAMWLLIGGLGVLGAFKLRERSAG